MAAVKYNFVYRSGAIANSPVPSFYTCVSVADITGTITDGDMAYCTSTGEFKKVTLGIWTSLQSSDLHLRVQLLEFLVFTMIKKGFGGL